MTGGTVAEYIECALVLRLHESRGITAYSFLLRCKSDPEMHLRT
jgi:hypothetical protein